MPTHWDTHQSRPFSINNKSVVYQSQLPAGTRNDKVLSCVYHYVTKGWPHEVDMPLATYAGVGAHGGSGVCSVGYLGNHPK